VGKVLSCEFEELIWMSGIAVSVPSPSYLDIQVLEYVELLLVGLRPRGSGQDVTMR
jgi:hypothetical protein